MYLSNINSKEDKLRKVQVCKNGNLQKCRSTSYLQSTLRVRTRQSPCQICSGCPPRWICCGSYTSRVFKGCLVFPETWRRSLVKSLAEEGPMLMARVWGFHAFTLSWESQEIAWTTTCEDYKKLGQAVYHSTGFLQNHNSHKRVLKMPLMVAVVSIS